MTVWFRQLPGEMRWVLILWIGVLVLVCWEQSYWWQVREDYLFGFLSLPFALYLLYERLPQIRKLLGPSPSAETLSKTLWVIPLLAALCFAGALVAVVLGALIRFSQGHSQPASFLVCDYHAGFRLGLRISPSWAVE